MQITGLRFRFTGAEVFEQINAQAANFAAHAAEAMENAGKVRHIDNGRASEEFERAAMNMQARADRHKAVAARVNVEDEYLLNENEMQCLGIVSYSELW